MRDVAGAAVVVVEDNPMNMSMMVDVLTVCGYRAVTSMDGDGIEDVIARERPVVVLLDIQLPNRSGDEICAAIRRDDRINKLPVWAVTAFADHHSRHRFRETGFDKVISKPLSIRDFLRNLAAL